MTYHTVVITKQTSPGLIHIYKDKMRVFSIYVVDNTRDGAGLTLFSGIMILVRVIMTLG